MTTLTRSKQPQQDDATGLGQNPVMALVRALARQQAAADHEAERMKEAENGRDEPSANLRTDAERANLPIRDGQ